MSDTTPQPMDPARPPEITRAATPSEPVLDAWTGAQALAERQWR